MLLTGRRTEGPVAAACSPAITHLSWGRIEADGLPPAKDYKLYPGGGRAWDWRETGTRHVPGIQAADVQELLDHGSDVVILSRGMHLVLQTAPETLAWLSGQGVEAHVLETNAAAALYAELRTTRAVGALLHSTC